MSTFRAPQYQHVFMAKNKYSPPIWKMSSDSNRPSMH